MYRFLYSVQYLERLKLRKIRGMVCQQVACQAPHHNGSHSQWQGPLPHQTPQAHQIPLLAEFAILLSTSGEMLAAKSARVVSGISKDLASFPMLSDSAKHQISQ